MADIENIGKFFEKYCRFMVTNFEFLNHFYKSWSSASSFTQLAFRIIPWCLLSCIGNNSIKIIFHIVNFDLEVLLFLLSRIWAVAFTRKSVFMWSRGIRLLLIFYEVSSIALYLFYSPMSQNLRTFIIKCFDLECLNWSKS